VAKEHLALYSNNCKRCRHLDPSEPTAFAKCHFSKGNKYCPASELQIVIVGQAYRYAGLVIAAREHRDPKAEARILAIVAKQPGAFQERFYSALENPADIR
jgi:hypothetical protein